MQSNTIPDRYQDLKHMVASIVDGFDFLPV